MAKSLTVRNVGEDLVRRLKIRAAKNGRSAEAEHREILKEVLERRPLLEDDFWATADRLRAATSGRRHTPSEELIREGREER